MRKTKKLSKSLIGDQGEAAFLLEATTRGFIVCKPFGNCAGFDFVLSNGTSLFKVQVKASNEFIPDARYKKPVPSFCIPFKSVTMFDVLILYKIDTKEFHVMPSSKVKASCIRLGDNSKYNKYKDNWNIFKP